MRNQIRTRSRFAPPRSVFAGPVGSLGVLLAVFASSPTHAALRTVALDNTAAPVAGLTFSFFEDAPVLNNNGQTAFYAFAFDSGFNDLGGLWSEGSGSLQNVALQGDPAPGAGGLSFGDLTDVRLFLNDNGDAGFHTTLDDFLTTGIFNDVGGTLNDVAIRHQNAPDTDVARLYSGFSQFGGFNDAGKSAFRATTVVPPLPGSIPSSGIWTDATGAVAKVAEIGTATPGITNGIFTSFKTPSINSAGTVAFIANDQVAGVTSGEGVWTSASGVMTQLARHETPAPGTSTTFSIFFGGLTDINDAGNVAFSATLTGLIGGGLRDGIWVHRNNAIEKVMFESEAAPMTGSTFEQIEEPFNLDANGDVTFVATLADGRRGIFSETTGSLAPVVLDGDVAPDSGGATIQSIVRWAGNDNGKVAFLADLSDFSTALFAQDNTGQIKRLVGLNDMLEVAPGDFREVGDLNFLGLDGSFNSNGTGQTSGFNNSGEVAFSAFFNNESTGIFVISPDNTPLAGDLDGDGFVGFSDLNLVLGNWNQNVPPADPAADPSGDGFVGFEDLNTVLGNWNAGTPPSDATPIPEPATWMGLTLFGQWLCRRGARKC